MASVEYVDPSPRRGRGQRHNVILLDSFRNPSRIASFAEDLGVPYPLASVLLANKSFDGADLEGLAATYRDAGFPEHPLLSWPGTADAVRDALAEDREAPVGIYGDYDADGVTSVLILRSALTEAGFVRPVLEFSGLDEEGFGFSAAGLRRLLDAGCRHAFVLDTGTNSGETLTAAVEAGMRVTVIDHHPLTAGRAAVPGIRYLNPHLLAASTPRPEELRNAGLTWYFGLALLRAAGLPDEEHHRLPLALAALGTVADAGKAGEGPHNRWLLREGLAPAVLGTVPGLKRLFGVPAGTLGLDVAEPRVAEGFRKASLGKRTKLFRPITVLRAIDPETPEAERDEAFAEIESQYGAFDTYAKAGASWLLEHDPGGSVFVARVPASVVPADYTGISGTLASKVAFQTGRPAVIFVRDEDGTLKGSWRMARTGMDGEALMRHVDQAAPGLLSRYGGHAAAGGILLPGSRELPFLDALLADAWEALGGPDTAGGRRQWPAKGEVTETFVTARWVLERDGGNLDAALRYFPFSRYEIKPPAFLLSDIPVLAVSGGKGSRVVTFAHAEGEIRCVLPAAAAVPLVGSLVDMVLSFSWNEEDGHYVLVADPLLASENRIGSFGDR